jgi:hypothetical protein
MHTLQRIVIKAENKEEAFQTVKTLLENEMGGEGTNSWYDWFVAGGGRWASDEKAQYDDDFMGDVISYEEEPERFMEGIEKSLQFRKDEFASLAKDYNEGSLDMNEKIANYKGETDYDFSLYPLRKLIDMLQGSWDYTSYFYDIDNWSTNPIHFKKAIDNGETNWYTVPVDFHF